MLLTREDYRGKTIEETTYLMTQKYGEHIRELAERVNPNVPAILVGHFWVKNAKVGAKVNYLNVNEPEIPLAYLANPAFDYVALGHVHKFQNLNRRCNPPVVYSGSIERVDFSERNEDKGFVFIQLERGNTSFEFVPVPTRQFVQIELDISRAADPTQAVVKEITKRNVSDAIVKVTVHSPHEKVHMIRDQEIRKALEDAFIIVGINKVVTKNERAQRAKLLHEAVDPLKALEMYFAAKNIKNETKDELLRYAAPLVEELMQEETA
jgi:exonuclease SbcD